MLCGTASLDDVVVALTHELNQPLTRSERMRCDAAVRAHVVEVA
jgi:hypothetical protein